MDELTSGQRAERHNEFQRAYYEHHGRSTITPAETPYVKRQVDEAIAAARVGPGDRVLDAGCGAGRHAYRLAARGLLVEGLDLSPELLSRLREGDRFGIPTHCADIADPPAALDGRFDAILGFFVLHHLLDLRAIFRGLARTLKPGGRIVFIEPNPFNALYYVQIAVTPGMRWRAERGILNMRRKVLFPALESAGFTRPSLRRFGFLPPFLRNRPGGGAIDRAVESVGLLEPALPFQLFRAEKPAA